MTLESAVYAALVLRAETNGSALADVAREILRKELLGAGSAVAEVRSRAEGVGAMAEDAIRDGLPNEAVARQIRDALPGANTTEASIRWYRSQMRKRGEDVPSQVEARRNYKD
jgi:hypothetical protein